MARSISFTTYTRNSCVNKPFMKKVKHSPIKVWQSHFKEIIKLTTLIITLSLSVFKISMHFFQIVTEEDCSRRKFAAIKSEKLKVFIINYYDSRKIYSAQFRSSCSVNSSCLYFFILGFQSSILHKLKKTLNCRLKLRKDNNRSF